MRVKELCGGDEIRLGIDTATFIGASPHPTYDDLALVVWILSNGQVSFDALSWEQDIGFLNSFRNDNLRRLDKVFGVSTSSLSNNSQ